MSTRTDAELLIAHAAGDRYAFEALFRRHHARLRRLARSLCRCPEDADDALQDAMLAAHRRAGTFRHQSAVASWLHRIVTNACTDRLRHNRAHATTTLDHDCAPAVDRAAQLDTTLIVHRALAALPAHQRDVVAALDLHGYSIADTAGLLGIPEGTVKSRANRGRSRLVAELRG